jgi:hypothetical protein
MIDGKKDLFFFLSKMKLSVIKIKVTHDKYFRNPVLNQNDGWGKMEVN